MPDRRPRRTATTPAGIREKVRDQIFQEGKHKHMSEISEEKLRIAKEKLACHIEPPGHSAAGGNASSAVGSASAGDGASCGISGSQESFIDPDGRVHLTRMTSAGG